MLQIVKLIEQFYGTHTTITLSKIGNTNTYRVTNLQGPIEGVIVKHVKRRWRFELN